MLKPITIEYPIRPKSLSLATGRVADLFGLARNEPPLMVDQDLALDVRPGDLALITGPSGSGKSSLLRAIGAQCPAIDALALELPDRPLVEALPGTLEENLNLLAACGLSEARLLLRTPGELSDGQRYRFRIAYALSKAGRANALENKTAGLHPPLLSESGAGRVNTLEGKPAGLHPPLLSDPGAGRVNALEKKTAGLHPPLLVVLDEFTATLDRTLAKVVAYNLRKLVSKRNLTVVAATTHEDIVEDLNPDLHIQCHGESHIEVSRREVVRKEFSLAHELSLTPGTVRDWPYFARWHYRSHHLGFVKRVILLRHRDEPIGICVFAAPAASLTLRSRYFGLKNPRSSVALSALNQQLWVLQRVVLHPTWRGAGIASRFMRQACELCPVPWIETLSAMGQIHPLFEHAGFRRVGVIRKDGSRTRDPKSRYSEPVYYVFDNRKRRSE